MSEASIAEAKTQFTRLVSRAELGEAVHITRRGKPVAVLLSAAEYARLCHGEAQRGFWELIVEMRDDPAFEPSEWSLEDVNAWRDRRPTQALTWPE